MSDNRLLDKLERVYNADDTKFTMGSKSGQVIDPTKRIHKNFVKQVTGELIEWLTSVLRRIGNISAI